MGLLDFSASWTASYGTLASTGLDVPLAASLDSLQNHPTGFPVRDLGALTIPLISVTVSSHDALRLASDAWGDFGRPSTESATAIGLRGLGCVRGHRLVIVWLNINR